jgi:hypothetical protein
MFAADALLLWPFVSPYLELRALGFPPRPLSEVIAYSADVFAYATAHERNTVWGGTLAAVSRRENELFPGLTLVLVAACGLATLIKQRWREPADRAESPRARRMAMLLSSAIIATIVVFVLILVTGGFVVRIGNLQIVRLHDLNRIAIGGTVLLVALIAVSTRAKAMLRLDIDARGWALAFLIIAFVLSLGPAPQADGRPLRTFAPYLWLYEHVPGFDGLRVPARFAMMVYVALAILSGYGYAVLERRRHGCRWVAAVAIVGLLESTALPYPLNATLGDSGVATPPPRVHAGKEVPPVYRALAARPVGTVIAELPFGYPSWELRYVFYSSVHWYPLANGYSGGFPAQYIRNAAVLMRPLERRDAAWKALLDSEVTDVVVHRDAFLGSEGGDVAAWLASKGAKYLGRFGHDELFELPPRRWRRS